MDPVDDGNETRADAAMLQIECTGRVGVQNSMILCSDLYHADLICTQKSRHPNDGGMLRVNCVKEEFALNSGSG
eukprot:CAMPEP_0115834502 /NCGR_PEP_ID=MMETSP0287-20121206/3715_1 /TAXON_ID=412157 /ORGANISM="Chrysochromulina rotalis, Strain UIO044" /LENGTH=73 /DNA_ID=CAMNT_0003287937 /DNA_START=672 /DNA_END=893 /DNA_ORIENTATION=+